MSRRIKGILFDLGDTLLNFGRLDVASLFEAGARLAYDYLKALEQPLPSFARFHRRQLWAIRWNYLKSRFTRREFDSLDLIGRLSERMGHDLTEQQVADLAWLWYEPVSRCAKVEEGAREMLDRFRGAGLVLGLVSNTFVPARVLDRHLEQEGLLEYLPVRVYSCDVRYRKPHRSIFDEALRQTGLEAEGTIFVGDSPKADIDGAHRAGMIPVLKDPADHHARSKVRCRHRIRKLVDLEKVVWGYDAP
jgi:HAD superfamily hydrolase (TIGR01509 family)